MKKTTIVKTSLLLFVAMYIMPTAVAQKTYTETHDEVFSVNLWSGRSELCGKFVNGPETYHYYYDGNDNKVKHGTAVFKVTNMPAAKYGATGSSSLNYSNGKKNGQVTQSFVIKLPMNNGSIAAFSYKLNGTYKDDLMDGTWTINNKGRYTASQTMNLSFTIKDRKIVSYDYKDWDNNKTKLTSSANGKLSGVHNGMSIKNNVFTNNMKDKDGHWAAISPKAKTFVEKLLNDKVSEVELIENGYCISTDDLEMAGVINCALYEGLQHGYTKALDGDIKLPEIMYVKQIESYEWADFKWCKSNLDQKLQQDGIDGFVTMAQGMIETHKYQRYFLNNSTVSSIEQYVQTSVKALREQAQKNLIQQINTSEKLGDFFTVVNSKKFKSDYNQLSDEGKKAVTETSRAKKSSILSTMKKSIEGETDYVALVNYYNNDVQSDLNKLPENNEVRKMIQNVYLTKKGELEKTASAKIVDEIKRQESTSELKKYYDGVAPVAKGLPDASSIQSSYDSKYSALEKAEQKAAKKAARKQKIITGAKWVGGAAVVVGGYFLVKHFGLLDK